MALALFETMRPSTCSRQALASAGVLWLSLLEVASGCAGDRPTFGHRVDTVDGGSFPDHENSGTAPLDASAITDAQGSAANTLTRRDGSIGPDNVDASLVNMQPPNRDASAPDRVMSNVPEAGASSSPTSAEPDSATPRPCNETIASGDLGPAVGSFGPNDLDILYLPELNVYAIAFTRGAPSSALALAIIDERGHVVTEPVSVTSPMLEESDLDRLPHLAWDGSALGVLLRGHDPEPDGSAFLLGLTLAVDGTVLSERQWPSDTSLDDGFELAAVDDNFLGFWHLLNGSNVVSVVQRLDATLQPVGSTWQPLAAEPWLPAVDTQGPRVALTRGTRDEAQLHVLSPSLDLAHVASIDEPNSGTPLVVGTSEGYALAWNRGNDQVRFAKYGEDGKTLACGPTLLSSEPATLAGLTPMEDGYLTLVTRTNDGPRQVEWYGVSENCVVGPAVSVTYESASASAAASGASTVAVVWVEYRTYRLKYMVMSNRLCH